MKQKFSTFNDGIVHICDAKERKTNFGAVKNATTRNDLTHIIRLNYSECSKRDEDIAFASSQGRTLSVKIKTRLYRIAPTQKAIIGDILYSIIKIDHDKSKQEMYIYMEEERRL